MKQQLWTEQATLFISIGKWTLYASGVGIIVGASTAFFLRLLDIAIRTVQHLSMPFLVTPLLLLLSKIMIDKLAPDAAGYGTDRLIYAIHNNHGHMPFMIVPIKLIASVLTIAAGGSAGKVGPCGQIGAGIASRIAGLLNIDDTDRKKLVVCGISAGFAAVFGTPIGGGIFGVEVLFLGKIMYEILFPAFVAGITAYHVAAALDVSYFRHVITVLPPYSEWVLIQCILLGLACGLAALFFIKLLNYTKSLFATQKYAAFTSLVGGIFILLVGSYLSPIYLGLGLDSIIASLEGQTLPTYAFLGKAVTTAITFAAGGSGGIILPTAWIGTAVGNLFAQILGSTFIPAYSAIGMVALLAAATNTPIAASIIAIELFGPEIAPYAAIACITSYIIIGHHSVFPTQILLIKKSASLEVPTGKPLTAITEFTVRPHGTYWQRLLRWLKIVK